MLARKNYCTVRNFGATIVFEHCKVHAALVRPGCVDYTLMFVIAWRDARGESSQSDSANIKQQKLICLIVGLKVYFSKAALCD